MMPYSEEESRALLERAKKFFGPAPSEGTRSCSPLSSTSAAPSNSCLSPTHLLNLVGVPASKSYTESWIKNSSSQNKMNETYCYEISQNEKTIDKNQELVRSLKYQIRMLEEQGDSPALIDSKRNEMLLYQKKISDAEAALINRGPCPIETCTKHHEITKDASMEVESGQYGNHYSDFKLVSPKKAAKIRNDVIKSPIKTSNKFNELTNLDENKPLIPTINLKMDANYNLILQEINRLYPETENKLIRGFINIKTNSLENREGIINLLKKNGKEFILSESNEDRPLKVVIKYLPVDQDKDALKNILEENGFKILRIGQLKNYRLKTPYPYFLVDVIKTPNHLNIYNIKTINHLKVKIESYRKKNRATICFKCSGFHHSAKNCECLPKCIKCAGRHETRNCEIKTIIENPICITCNGEGHLASWRGCPKFPKINKTPAKSTYAQKLKINLTPHIPPTNSEKITEPAEHLSNSDTGDFQEIRNALQTVKNALNEFPNLLEISKLLNKAKDKFEKLNLLIQLIN
ncbi:Nucleic-acid-binding protein from transposon X-element [Araneus ventricosus]|uniref:Nucleic-acid-binding protein from transposon X-element n=1 Tax=Araneus ventricosus TaxID=182803 RepID=A0A4Y2WAL7_ARAVE|nr:Nucleic-acid-binding protein from transposon X-element [Araneus ventricosus]